MRNNRICTFVLIVILLVAQFYPAAASSVSDKEIYPEPSYISMETVSTLKMLAQLETQSQPSMDFDVSELIKAANNAGDTLDTDGDLLPDSVEIIIGTDYNETDSDLDQLDDYNETVIYETDPLNPDSNDDGLPDYHEVTDVMPDLDEDGFPNAWDLDNDGDGVIDGLDTSPFSRSTINKSFHFDIRANGSPTYIDFQIRPKDPDHLRLPVQSWDWPVDHEGSMMDLNLSNEDVRVVPMLKLTMNTAPEQSEVKDYNINVVGADNYRVALKAINGMYISVDENVLASSGNDIGENETFELIDIENNTVAFKIDDGQYFSMNGTGVIGINGSEIGENETFELVDLDNNTVALKASNGLYVNATGKGGFIANNDTVGTNETFELIFIKEVALKSSNGLYVSALGGGAGGLFADADKIGSWETFELIDFGDTVALRAINEMYVYGGEGGLVANRYTIDTGEIFELIDLGNSKVAMNASNGLFVSIEGNKLVANSTTIGSDETFEMESLEETKSKAYIPLVSVNDNGNSLALKGRMFYPSSAPLNLSADAELVWIVQGKTDQTGRKVAFNNTAGQYMYHKENKKWPFNGEILVNEAGPIDQKKTFELVELGGNKVALKASNGKYITYEQRFFLSFLFPKVNPLLAKSDKIDTKETFEIESIENKVRLKASNNMYISFEDSWGDAFVLGSLGDAEKFEMIDVAPTESETTILASYKEDFMLTGFSVEENYGSDAGVFYSDDKNQTLQAGLVMMYDFMRNQTSLPEMPALINNTNVTISSNISSFSHQDGALLSLASQMTPNALNLLPEDQNLPIIIALEDHLTNKNMEELVPGSYITGNSFEFDLTVEPIATIKTMKMCWYNTTTKESLEPDAIYSETEEWGQALALENDDMSSLMALIFIWIVGEITVTRIGSEQKDFGLGTEASTIYDVVNNIKTIFSLITIALFVFQFAKMFSIMFDIAKRFNYMDALKGEIKFLHSSVKNMKYRKALKSIGWVFDILLAGYMFFAIGFATDWSTAGTWTAVFAATIMIVFSYLLGVLFVAFPVGTIIFAIYLIISLIFDFDVVTWLVGLFYKVKERTKLDLKIRETNPFLDDYDKNGLDVGDRIELRSRMVETVWKTSDGSSNDVTESFITPDYILGTAGESYRYTVSAWDDSTWVYNPFLDKDIKSISQRQVKHDVGIWTEPESSQINFPLTFCLSTQYKFYYTECSWFGLSCDRKSKSGSSKSDRSTIYYDVLPGNISEFAGWPSITSLDRDGDGLLNSEEGIYGTGQYVYDTDGDGLHDKFEVDYGTSPVLTDTDGDKLDDGSELRRGTDPNKRDTDGDDLTDFEEIRGWLVSFTYGGQVFIMHTTSDPLLGDTDNDGLTDFEEFYKKLNPRSKDTDGDGTGDAEVFGSQFGIIKYLDMNREGNSIKLNPGENISARVGYRIKGKEFNGSADAVQMVVTMNNSSFIIYNGTPEIGNKTDDVSNLSFNAPTAEGVYTLKYYLNWSSNGSIPLEDEREIIGVIDTTDDICNNAAWVNGTVDGQDTDSDGINNTNEKIGWAITFTGSDDVGTYGTFSVHVTSEGYIADTDYDGLTDLDEFNYCSNPRDVDTDGDMLTDFVENGLGTDLLVNDTDGDGLDDGKEVSFGSDPIVKWDTDDDNLTDLKEFDLTSDPVNNDTDGDGLDDYFEENIFGSNLLNPDSDEDMLQDQQEYEKGTDPWNPDTDDDSLTDGYEVSIGTNASNNDTDYDSIPDNEELDMGTDPVSNDTDGDGLLDGDELDLGTDPTSEDTDGDEINDYEDQDSYSPHVPEVVLCFDEDGDTYDFINNLARYTNVTIVTPDNLTANYTNEQYIILVGRPEPSNGTAGNITYDILKDSGEILESMLNSDSHRLFTGYGIWNSSQTVVMLSHPYSKDHFKVLNILKSFRKYVGEGSVIVEYSSPTTLFNVEAVKETDSFIRVDMEQSVIPTVEMNIYNSTNVPTGPMYGLSTGEIAVDKCVDINVSENIQNGTGDIIDHVLIAIYYTAPDLDQTGDGDADDVGDIDENTLGVTWFNESSGRLEKLITDMDWVYEVGVETSNIDLYGKHYEGIVWANVSHLSLFGISGREIQPSPEEKDDGGLNIYPMFLAIPELTYYKYIHLTADVEQLISIPNIPAIYELSVKNPQNINLMLYLSKIKSLPSDVSEAPYKNYSYFELLFTKFKTNQKENPVTQINFMVPKNWSDDNGGITLMQYENGWNPVNTEVISEDGENYYLRAEVNSYSIFAIVQSPLEEVTTPLYNIPDDPLPDDSEPDIQPIIPLPPNKSKLELILSIFALLIGLGVVSYMLKKRRT